MSSTSQLLQERDLELNAGRTLTCAFDEAWASVRTSSSWLHQEPGSEAARMILAKRIIAAAGKGEQTVSALADDAVKYLARWHHIRPGSRR
jgi:hypothetical protein